MSTRPDCARCQALCCVALPFQTSGSFPVDKDGGAPCRNLLADDRCGIHAHLRREGWIGCTVFDCFGAGQHVSTNLYAGRHWRDDADVRAEMFEVFPVMHQLFEMLFHLQGVTGVEAERAEVEAAVQRGAEVLDLDVAELRGRVGDALTAASARLREGRRGDVPAYAHARADLAGRDLRGHDLRGAELRGALLLGVDLRGVDLAYADLLGADLRGARLEGARLGEALFVAQAQINACRGDASTTLPAHLDRPGWWPTGIVGPD